MKKQKNVKGFAKRNRKNHIKAGLFIFISVILLAIFIFIGYIWNVLKYAEIFKVSEVVIKNSPGSDLSYLKGRNIFDLSLEKESSDILRAYPNYRGINLVKVLPGRVFVEFIERNPVALIKLYRYFAIDEYGVLFYIQGVQLPEFDLPVITGLETKLFGPKPGVKYNVRELNLALKILREAEKTHILRYYKIHKIDIASFVNASVFISPVSDVPWGLEVKIGSNDIENKMEILAGLIIGGRNDISAIKYIDLRFNEPVIKLNDAKSK